MDLDTVFSKAKEYFIGKEGCLNCLKELEDYLEEEGYDIGHLQDESSQMMIKDHLKKQNNSQQAINVFEKIIQIINHNQNTLSPLQIVDSTPNESQYLFIQNFIKLFPNSRSTLLSKKDNYYAQVDQYIPNQYDTLKRLEKVSEKNNIAITEHLITGYHQSGLSREQYIAHNQVFKQLRAKYNLAATNQHTNLAYNAMVEYLSEYEKHISKPLPQTIDHEININKFNDNIIIIINYIIEIQNAINLFFLQNAKYPLQLDVFFVAPDTHKWLNLEFLDSLSGLGGKRPKGDAISVMINLLRTAAIDINRTNGQRFIILIVRGKKENSLSDKIYIYKPQTHNSIPPAHVSDNVELTYLLNSQSCIVPGLSPAAGVLGLTHHLHSADCTKVYLSYGQHKSRIFKKHFLDKLQLLFNTRHYISNAQRTRFMSSYPNFPDVILKKYVAILKRRFNNPVAPDPVTHSEHKQQAKPITFPTMQPMTNTKSLPTSFINTNTNASYSSNYVYVSNNINPMHPYQSTIQPFGGICPALQQHPALQQQQQQQYFAQIFKMNQTFQILNAQNFCCNNIISTKKQASCKADLLSMQQQTVLKQSNVSHNNKKKKRRKNNKSKKRLFTNEYRKKYGNCATYNPPSKKGARSNIQIPREFTAKIPDLIEEKITDIFSYIDKGTAVHRDNHYNEGKIRIFNYDFHDKKGGEVLYCVAERNGPNNRRLDWKMVGTLFTKQNIKNIYNVSDDILPKSIRTCKSVNINHQHINAINKIRKTVIFDKKQKWNKLPIYCKKPKHRTCRSKLSITVEKFKKQIFEKHSKKLIPMLMFKNNDICIQYLWVVSIRLNSSDCVDYLPLLTSTNWMASTYNFSKNIIDNILSFLVHVPSTDIGIAFEYNSNKKCVEAVGIHLDKYDMINNHQLLYPQHSMHDLDDFESNYDDLHIGNVDEDENYIKDLRKQHEIAQEEIKRLETLLSNRNNV